MNKTIAFLVFSVVSLNGHCKENIHLIAATNYDMKANAFAVYQLEESGDLRLEYEDSFGAYFEYIGLNAESGTIAVIGSSGKVGSGKLLTLNINDQVHANSTDINFPLGRAMHAGMLVDKSNEARFFVYGRKDNNEKANVYERDMKSRDIQGDTIPWQELYRNGSNALNTVRTGSAPSLSWNYGEDYISVRLGDTSTTLPYRLSGIALERLFEHKEKINVQPKERLRMSLWCNDKRTLVAGVQSTASLDKSVYLTYDKDSAKWNYIEAGRSSRMQMFQSWLLIQEQRTVDGSKEKLESGWSIGGPIPPGYQTIPTGGYAFYNRSGELQFKWKTTRDTETIEIVNDTVYFRRNDELYKASIIDNEIKNEALVCKDEKIQDVHWLLISR